MVRFCSKKTRNRSLKLVYSQVEIAAESAFQEYAKMKIVVAMDSFKDSLTAARVCDIVKENIASAEPDAEIITKPMADGGEGTAKALMAAAGGTWIEKTVTGALPDMKVNAGFAWFAQNKTALVEMAAASGLELLSPHQRNPYKTTTYGTGQLIDAAVNYGAEKILLAVGGSATVDGGTGAAAALGIKFLDENGKEIYPCGGELLRIRKIIPHPKRKNVEVQVLCDVDNPLCGEHGAARTYGPQKGATPEMVEQLEAGLSHLAELVKKQLGIDINNLPGAGAAGGLSAGAVAFMGARLVSGIETVMAQSRLPEALNDADWVITGEGRFDHQSLRGKVVSGIVALAKQTDAKVAVLAGQVLLGPDEYNRFGITEAIGCMQDNMTLEYAIENAETLLADAAKKFAAEQLRG